jgi:hypothetical protein
MGLLSTSDVTRLNSACPLLHDASLGSRLQYVGTDGSLTPPAAGVINIPLDRCKLPTLLPLAAAAASGVFGMPAGTFGATVSPTLIGNASNSSAKTDITRFEIAMPQDYVAAGAVTIAITATLTASTASTTKTIDLIVNKSDLHGGATSILATGAQALGTAATWYTKTFTLTATTLVPGDIIDCEIIGILNDTHATGVITIGDIRMTYARKLV